MKFKTLSLALLLLPCLGNATDRYCVTRFCDDPKDAELDAAADKAIAARRALHVNGRAVRIFAPGDSTVTGDTLPARAIIAILFTDEACPLAVEGAANMRRAWQATGAYQLGCWFPTAEQKWFFVGQIESLTHEGGGFWQTFPRALLHPDGSATITEPNYNSATFLSDFAGNRMMHMFDHAHDRP